MLVDLPPHLISNINTNVANKDFKFIIGGHEHVTNSIFADLISPRVSRLHSTDPTVDSLTIDVNDPSDFFKFFIALAETGHCELIPEMFSFVWEICEQLENYLLLSVIVTRDLSSCELNLSNVLKFLNCVPFLVSGSHELIRITKFASSHFVELNVEELNLLPIETLSLIISDESLRIHNEDFLLNFIVNLIQIRGDEFKYLLSSVDLRFLSVDGISTFLSKLSFDDLTGDLWENIVKRLRIDTIPAISAYPKKYKCISNVFEPKDGHYFKGIINYLNSINGGSCYSNGTIEVSLINKDEKSHEGMFDYENINTCVRSNYQGSCYQCSNYQGSKIQFLDVDFKDRKIDLTHYSFNVSDNFKPMHYPHTWNVEGSNDRMNWTILDKREKDTKFNSCGQTVLYQCINDQHDWGYRYIRFWLCVDNYEKGFGPLFSKLEFFGSIYE